MHKQQLFLSIALLTGISFCSSAYAIPIESRGLSQAGGSAQSTNNPGAPVAGNLNWDLLQKNQDLENQIRELRGKIEEQDHQIEQLNKELTNRYTDLDQRLELLQQRLDPNEGNDGQEEVIDADAQPHTESTSNAAPTTAQSPAAIAQASNTSDPQQLEEAAYTVALDAYKKGGAKQAIAPMQNFIKNYPNSKYTGNAYFWLAEFNLAIDPPKYAEAKKNYEVVAAKFPNSGKAPRALYQLYSIAQDVEHNAATAKVYKNKLLSAYPQSEEAGYLKK
ncbi:YbgF trimerization domain-containing protein [Acinetobacter larvae]|uniref:YbgF trimerisation domain-containing protein n=1 Tax=Acinetobacter larvae TaxID=1789224 RepID=A0A1B2M0G9_9GAMM|nr:YbgF trimerization domain-containing protein [Acinetobacter larvae]AOA58697.1 hypothetical protein BFG52_10250 [Acinetobacter larvae]